MQEEIIHLENELNKLKKDHDKYYNSSIEFESFYVCILWGPSYIDSCDWLNSNFLLTVFLWITMSS